MAIHNESSSAQAPRMPRGAHLRLVHGAAAAVPPSGEQANRQVVASRRLVGVRAVGEALSRPGALHAMVQSLRPCAGTLRLRFGMDATPGPEAVAAFVDAHVLAGVKGEVPEHRLDWALQAAWPELVFARHSRNHEPPRTEQPVQHLLQAQPLRLTRRPPPRRTAGEAEVIEAWVPNPGSWPGAWLVTPFQSALHPEPWVLELDFQPWQPDEARRAEWHRILLELRRGAWRVVPAGAAPQHALHDADLDAAAQALLKQWLTRQEGGYTLQVRVRSQTAWDDWALRRLTADIYGQQPVLRLQPGVQGPAPWPACWLPEQGEGGWMPAPAGLLRSGVPLQAPEPALLPQGPGVVLGHTAGAREVLLPDAIRTGHLLVVGASGTGKSTTLCRLLGEDIEAGGGVVLIDPHGDLFDRVLQTIPARRLDDVVIIDVEDETHSVAFNPLDGTLADPAARSFMAGAVVDLIGQLFEGADTTGPTLRNHLRHAVLLAMCHPGGGTLADAGRIILDRDFRQRLLLGADAALKQHFSSFEATSGDSGFTNWLPYIRARFEPFYSSRVMLASLSRPSTINLAGLLQGQAIVLVKLSRHVLTEAECRVFGALFLLSCFRAAMANRAAGSVQAPCRLVVDEFQLFATPALPSLFREARKFGLSMTVATQSFGSLRHPSAPNLVNDVLTNTAAKLIFRVSPAEAATLEEYTAPQVQARALSRLPNRQAVLALPSLGIEALQTSMVAPSNRSGRAPVADLRRVSHEQHAHPMRHVQDFLVARHGLLMDGL